MIQKEQIYNKLLMTWSIRLPRSNAFCGSFGETIPFLLLFYQLNQLDNKRELSASVAFVRLSY